MPEFELKWPGIPYTQNPWPGLKFVICAKNTLLPCFSRLVKKKCVGKKKFLQSLCLRKKILQTSGLEKFMHQTFFSRVCDVIEFENIWFQSSTPIRKSVSLIIKKIHSPLT